MKQLPRLFLSLTSFISAMTFAASNVCGTTSTPARLQEKPKPAGAALKIHLRLADDRPFAGTASLRVMPNEGYELSLNSMESEGEYVFSDVAPGNYFVEVSAPGFLAQRLRAQVEEGAGQKIIIVVMRPRPVPKISAAMLRELREGKTTNSKPIERNHWKAHELEEFVPTVDGSVPCPTDGLLSGVGEHMAELVANLERFTAKEQVEHFTVEGETPRGSPELRTFDYVVTVSRNAAGTFMLQEYRNGKDDPDLFPVHVATLGLPGLALLFHPELARDFTFQCEGLGQWGGQVAWQVHFAQRADRPMRMRSYSVNGKTFHISMEGRAWIDPGSYQVMRLESELAKPIPDIGLAIENIAIDYALVQFRTQQVQIWLPRAAELYVDRRGHRFYRKHAFSDFRIFNVDTAQSVERPKESYVFTNLSDHDITGVLAVFPADRTKHEVVTLTFNVPAQGKVVRVVGIGKDVDLPIAEVASATFTHNGADGAIKVDVDLGRETTLEVVSGSVVKQ